MLNFCMKGFSKAVGLGILSFSAGVIAGAALPAAAVAVIALVLLTVFGYLCLFVW